MKIKKKKKTQISIQQYSRQQLICVLDAEHDLKNSVFKVIGYFKYEFNFFFVLKFLTGRLSIGCWSVHLVSGRLDVGWWSVGRIVGGLC